MKVAVIMGSDSDFDVMKNCADILKRFEIDFDVSVISAHRTPEKLVDYMKGIAAMNIDIIIAAAGKAAHLPGVIAALTTIPVIGVPIKSSTLDGMDSLLSIVQMPPGIPVATVAINGSENAGILAVQILSLKYECLKGRIIKYRESMKKQMEDKDLRIKEEVKLLWKK